MATNKDMVINGVTTPVTEFSHSAQEIDDAVDKAVYLSNPNLLDNPDFTINQRGKKVYSAAGQTVDRWSKNGNGTVTVTDSGLILETPEGTTYDTRLSFWQYLDFNPGTEVYTFSMLVDGELYSVSGTIQGIGTIKQGLPFGHLLIQTDGTGPFAQISIINGGAYAVSASKLDPGTEQTLAHLENGKWVKNATASDKAIELTKCQSHQMVFGQGAYFIGVSNGKTSYVPCALPVSLRERPAVVWEGATLYRGIEGEHLPVKNIGVSGMAGNCVLLGIVMDTAFSAGQSVMLELENAGSYIILDANLK